MDILLPLVCLVLVLTPALGQSYMGGCGVPLEDIPDPASDSCVAFYRCYQNRQYSLRCPLGQAFHFDRARCRPESEVDCPLQLQRFQAPAVPHYLRPPQAQQEREVEIRVVHVIPSTGSSNIQSSNSAQVPVLSQASSQGGQILAAGQSQQTVPPLHAQQMPFFFRTAGGHIIQTQGVQSQTAQTQYIQPPAQQTVQGQAVKGQILLSPPQQNPQSAAVQGQSPPSPSQQNIQSSAVPVQSLPSPSQQNPQSSAVQGQSLPSPLQQNSQSSAVQGQTSPSPAQQNIQIPAAQGQNPPYSTEQTGQGQPQDQSNIPIFAPSFGVTDQDNQSN